MSEQEEAFERALDVHYEQWRERRWAEITAQLVEQRRAWLAERDADQLNEDARGELEGAWADRQSELESDYRDDLREEWPDEERAFSTKWAE